ncbi:hypothetical protein [Paenibacillus sp. 1P07SE]|uniref:hypothetical protein n=1 Tax=Paenibacillus sp. 1P07SE TaxID=3132209 RepID=UPI0039A488D2
MREPENMTGEYEQVPYILRTQNAEYSSPSISGSHISDIITNLELHEFIVIEPAKPIKDSIYMQAAMFGSSEESVTVEVRLSYDEESFKHYSYETTDKQKVVRLFLDYWGLQQMPDLAEWADISDQF